MFDSFGIICWLVVRGRVYGCVLHACEHNMSLHTAELRLRMLDHSMGLSTLAWPPDMTDWQSGFQHCCRLCVRVAHVLAPYTFGNTHGMFLNPRPRPNRLQQAHE